MGKYVGSTHPNTDTYAALSVSDPYLKLTAQYNCDLTKIGTVGELAKSLAMKSQVARQRKRNIHRTPSHKEPSPGSACPLVRRLPAWRAWDWTSVIREPCSSDSNHS